MKSKVERVAKFLQIRFATVFVLFFVSSILLGVNICGRIEDIGIVDRKSDETVAWQAFGWPYAVFYRKVQLVDNQVVPVGPLQDWKFTFTEGLSSHGVPSKVVAINVAFAICVLVFIGFFSNLCFQKLWQRRDAPKDK